MSNFQKRIIITGGPGSGKSSLIEALKRRGFKCSPEAGRAIIQDQVLIGGNALPWANRDAFAELMLCWELRSWHKAEHHQTCYFDRGIPDIAGYLSLCNLPIPQHLEEAIRVFRYNEKVFIAPPWRDIYVQDSERKQSMDEAVLTYEAMIVTYENYGYELLELPYSSVDERADFIIKNQ